MQYYECRSCKRRIEVIPAVWVVCCGRKAKFLGEEQRETRRETKSRRSKRIGKVKQGVTYQPTLFSA
jgi:hypothetical protein